MWNASAAATHARVHARSQSTGMCARYVRLAIAAGGINIARTEDAKDYGYALRQAGFTEYSDASSPRRGDVIVIQPAPGHPHGHMAIYDGANWISDFTQCFYPGQA